MRKQATIEMVKSNVKKEQEIYKKLLENKTDENAINPTVKKEGNILKTFAYISVSFDYFLLNPAIPDFPVTVLYFKWIIISQL